MKIGLNLLYLIPGVVGGTEIYARGLLEGLADVGGGHEYVVCLSREALSWPPPLPPFFRIQNCGVDARRRAARYAYEQLVLLRQLRRDGVQVLHSLGYVMPLWTLCRTVITVPDLNFRAVADTMPWSRRVVLDALVRASVEEGSGDRGPTHRVLPQRWAALEISVPLSTDTRGIP